MIYITFNKNILLKHRTEKDYSTRYHAGAIRTTPRPSIVHQQDLANLPNDKYLNDSYQLDKKSLRYITDPDDMQDIDFINGITSVESSIEYKRNSIALPRIFAKSSIGSQMTYRVSNYLSTNPRIYKS